MILIWGGGVEQELLSEPEKEPKDIYSKAHPYPKGVTVRPHPSISTGLLFHLKFPRLKTNVFSRLLDKFIMDVLRGKAF